MLVAILLNSLTLIENTVVLPYFSEEGKNNSPTDSINYPMLEVNFIILQNAITAKGKKLKIIRIPMPES